MRRYIKNGFTICTECGVVVVDELWARHANTHWSDKTEIRTFDYKTDTYEVDPQYDDETQPERSTVRP